jgi:hypothetical protein
MSVPEPDIPPAIITLRLWRRTKVLLVLNKVLRNNNTIFSCGIMPIIYKSQPFKRNSYILQLIIIRVTLVP